MGLNGLPGLVIEGTWDWYICKYRTGTYVCTYMQRGYIIQFVAGLNLEPVGFVCMYV
jgi:hypothetical protein